MRKLLVRHWPLIAIIIIAAFLRFYNLTPVDGLPPGLYPDEAMNGNNALEALSTGEFKVFYPENNGREGLFINIQAIFLTIFGNQPWALRLPSALFGILTVLGVYFLAKELFGENPKSEILNPKQITNPNNSNSKRFKIWNFKIWNLFRISSLEFRVSHGEKIALLSAFFLAVSFWHINFSRIGFRAIMAPFFLTWALYFLLLSIRKATFVQQTMSEKSEILNPKFETNPKFSNSKFKTFISSFEFRASSLAILAGLLYGLGFYSYIAYRATPLLVIVIFIYYWLQNKEKSIRKKILLSIFYFLLSTLIVAAPLGLYFLQNHQDFFGRTSEISIFNSSTPLKDLGMNIIKTAGMFNFMGDWNWRHNIAGRPLLFWPVGILFLIGIAIGIYSIFKNPNVKIQMSNFGFWILFSWLIITILPVVISNEGIPHALRSLLMAPAVFILAGIGGTWLYKTIKSRIKSNLSFMFHVLCFMILSLFVFEAYYTYFIKWGENRNVWDAFAGNYARAAQELNKLPKEWQKYVIVEASGTDVRGIPMPSQTIMFITDTFTPEKQKEKNIYYVLGSQKDQVPKDSYVVFLK